MNKRLFSPATLLLTLTAFILTTWLGGCVTATPKSPVSPTLSKLTDMESIALCQMSQQTTEIEHKIAAEYGFRRFAEHTYRPVIKQALFGHEIRVVELEPTLNKLYVAGNPLEFGHHFSSILPHIRCEDNTCQAPINAQQTLHIYRPTIKKVKDTTVIECTKPNLAVKP